MTGAFLKNFRLHCQLSEEESAQILQVTLREYQILENNQQSITCEFTSLTGKFLTVSYLYLEKASNRYHLVYISIE